MPSPGIDSLVGVIITRLKNITNANSYAFDVGTVKKPDRDSDEWNPFAKDIYIEQQEESENPNHSCPGNPPRIGYDIEFLIHGFARQLDRDEAEFGILNKEITENKMASAIRKAITNGDAGTWHTFGITDSNFHVIDAMISTTNHFDEPGWDGVTVSLVVHYRVSELDSELSA